MRHPVKRLIIVLGSVAILATAVAPVVAEVINGTSGPDVLYGTEDRDTIRGFEGADRIYGKGSRDYLNGGTGPRSNRWWARSRLAHRPFGR
jgi:Ca2+-binding RTX toxin-like protein